MSDQPMTHEALPLIEALLDGTIDDAGFARLEALLLEDARVRSLYRSYINLHAALPGVVGQSPRLSVQITDGQDQPQLEPHEMPHAQLMELLVQVESSGQDVDPMSLAATRFPAEAPEVLSRRDWFQAGRYVLRHAMGARGLAAAVAAALVLLASVYVLTRTGGPEAELATGGGAEDALPAAVATLTGERRALWRAESGTLLPAVGDDLRSGQRLTLIEGFAEVTTRRGAVAVLEGPVTVEFSDNDNGLFLHEGRLVGTCLTERSKGFVVQTQHAVVTDIGTEFGVNVTPGGATQAAVFVGEVELSGRGTSDEQQAASLRLTEGWASTVSEQGRLEPEAVAVSYDMQVRYAKSLEEVDEPGFAYRRAVMALSPRLYWQFEPSADGAILDTMGLADSVGQVQGDPVAEVKGLLGQGVAMGQDPAQSACLVSAGQVLGGYTQAYTISLWVKPDRVHHGRVAALIGVESEIDTSKSHLCAVEVLGDQQWLDQNRRWYPSASAASLRFLHRDPLAAGQGENLYTDRSYEPGQWMLVTAVKSGSALKIYHNGELAATAPDQQAVAGQVRLTLGNLPPDHTGQSDRPFVGVMDEVSVFDQALDADQVKQLYQLGRAVLDAEAGTQPGSGADAP